MKQHLKFLILLVLTNLQLYSMEQVGMKDKIIFHRVENFKLAKFWIAKIMKIFKQQMVKLVSDNEAQATIKLRLIEEIGLVGFCDDLKQVSNYLEHWWNEGINSPEYLIKSNEFIEDIRRKERQNEAMYCTYLTGKEEEILSKKDLYTIVELSDVILTIIQERITLDQKYLMLNSENLTTVIKHFFISYFIQTYALSESDRKLSWCTCAKVEIYTRIIQLLLMFQNISESLKSEDCTSERPLVYTSFGSGRLLHDYIALLLLHYQGYKYFIVNFIDWICEQYCIDELKSIFTNQWLLFANAQLELNFFEYSKDFLKSSSRKNDILVSIDTLNLGNKAKLHFNELINLTTDSRSSIYSIDNNIIMSYLKDYSELDSI